MLSQLPIGSFGYFCFSHSMSMTKTTRIHLSKEIIEEKLSTLQQQDAIIIRQYLLENKSQQEIAKELSSTIAKTRSRISKALLELRKVSNDPDYIKAMKILKE